MKNVVSLPVETNHEAEKLRGLIDPVHWALGEALNRLESAGLAHEDLRSVFLKSSNVLGEGRFPETPSEGPFVYGTLTNALPWPTCRFVFSESQNALTALEFLSAHGWVTAGKEQWGRFLEWLLEDNDDMIDHPHNWGLEKSDDMPVFLN